MHQRRADLVELGGWSMVAAMGVLAVTQAVGWTGLPVVFAAQAMTPYLLTPAVPIAVIAASFQRHALAAVAALVAVCLLWLSMPVVFHDSPPPPAADAIELRVAHANIYLGNPRPDHAAEALLALDADVIAITEYSERFATVLRSHGIEASHPFHVDRAPGDRNGVALFSRYPITAGEVTRIGHQLGIDVVIDVHGTPVRVLVVHPLPGVDQWMLDRWRADLPVIGDRALTGTTPTVVVGDFNASRWHPGFRQLLGRGLTDAHEQLGRGFSVSWPHGWSTPTFVRLDHALMADGLVATDIDDIVMPGSDHGAFVVTVATT